jgi:hypothetical protein
MATSRQSRETSSTLALSTEQSFPALAGDLEGHPAMRRTSDFGVDHGVEGYALAVLTTVSPRGSPK